MSLDVAQYIAAEALTPGIAWHDELPKHLSPTQLAMFQRCPRQYQERYVFGRKERPAEAPVIGSAVHAALEINFGQKIESHEDMPVAELLDWYSEIGFPSTILNEEKRNDSEVLWDTDPEQARTRGRVMLGEYRNAVTERIQPISVEGEFSIDMGCPVPIIGRYDVEEARRTIDIKTGKRSQRKPKEAWRIQGAVYNQACGKPVEFHSVSATVSNAVTIVTPLESEELLVQLSETELAAVATNARWIASQITLCMELFGFERTWPVTGRWHDWACSYCGFRSDCPAWEAE